MENNMSITGNDNISEMDIKDAVSMLSSIFHKILKINLTNDTYSIISTYDWERKQENGYAATISLWMENFAYAGNVHEEDKARYLEFVNIDGLRNFFKNNRCNQSIKYRRKVYDQFKWVEMKLVPGREYQDDNQIVYLYIRDIDDECSKDMNDTQQVNEDVVMDLTADKLEWKKYGKVVTTINEGIGRIADSINDLEERKNFTTVVNRDALLNSFNSGEKYISQEISSVGLVFDNQLSQLNIYIKFSMNPENRHAEARLYVYDITVEHINQILPKILYDREYLSVGIIQSKINTLYIHKFDKGEKTSIFLDSNFCKFDEFINQKLVYNVAENDRDEFLENCKLSTILGALDKQEVYEINIVDRAGEYKRIRYQWFEEKEKIILCTVEDLSVVTEKDLLTGELNQRGFYSHVERVIEENRKKANPESFAILYFDIFNFKAVNELFGFGGGDRVLKSIPAVIRKSKICPKVLARFSGDHFVCLVNVKDVDDEKLKKICDFVHEEEEKKINLYQRCGVYYINDDTVAVRIMCDHARLALGSVENVMVKPFEIYADKMGETYLDRSELITEVKRALENEEFCTYFQPVFDPNTNKLVSAEALVRWKHPERGMISPGIFIPVLEELGIVSGVDRFIARDVKKLLEDRVSKGKKIVPVSVNLSRMDFYDSKLMEDIKKGLSSTELAKEYFRFEVTESSYMTLTENNLMSLSDLRKLGAYILIDDFGSGYSSFGAITDYSFDIIKLDMSFVKKIGRNPKVLSVIHALIDMIHHLDAKVVAEGAEDEIQVDFLRRHGCDYIQGYYYSKPLPKGEFIKMLDEA